MPAQYWRDTELVAPNSSLFQGANTGDAPSDGGHSSPRRFRFDGETRDGKFSRAYGTSSHDSRCPSAEALGYWQVSLRDRTACPQPEALGYWQVSLRDRILLIPRKVQIRQRDAGRKIQSCLRHFVA